MRAQISPEGNAEENSMKGQRVQDGWWRGATMPEKHCIFACFSISLEVISACPKEEQKEVISLPWVFHGSMRCCCAITSVIFQLRHRLNSPLGTRLGA